MTARPHVQHRNGTPSVCAGMCTDDRAGHAATLLRLRLAHLAPDGWRDAVVAGTADDGTIRLVSLAEDAPVAVWHHVARTDLLPVGQPVALHAAYGVLAIGDERLNVAPV